MTFFVGREGTKNSTYSININKSIFHTLDVKYSYSLIEAVTMNIN